MLVNALAYYCVMTKPSVSFIGLCFDQDIIDTRYIFAIEEFTFRGLLGRTNISLNPLTNHWEIISHLPRQNLNHVVGILNDDSAIFPLGANISQFHEN